MKHSILKFAAIAAIAASAAACTEIDNYPDGRVSFDEIWTQDRFVLGYLHDAYTPLLSLRYGQGYGYEVAGLGGVSFLDAATDNARDVDDIEGGAFYQWNNGMVSTANNPIKRLNIWENTYRGIAHCNILIAQIPDARIFVQEDATRWMAEAHGLRAMYYLQLLKNYGGVPMVLDTRIDENGNEVPDQVDDSDYDFSHVRRASVAEVARQILKDCQFVLDSEYPGWRTEDDGSNGRINKAIASAVMSQTALYAASPLNYDASDPEAIDWNEAATITKKALDDCLAHGYALYTTKPTSAGNANEIASCAYDHMFMQNVDVKGSSEKEQILLRTQSIVWQYNTAPLLDGQTRAGSCPTQELIDAYETTDGKAPILGYDDAQHLQPIFNVEATLYDENDPYANRDPRLKATIYYNGGSGHMTRETPVITTGEGGKHQISSSSVRYTRTGYYLHKYFNITSSRTALQDGYYRIFRLAELYLNHAEAAAEAGDLQGAVNSVRPVRNRVGMPMWSSDITSDKDKLIERIRNERRVEFAFEDHRFYDVRRWMILDQTAVATGMRPVENITTETEEVTTVDPETGEETTETVITENRELLGYQRFVVSTSRATESKYLRMPIDIKEQVALESATGQKFQNPGW